MNRVLFIATHLLCFAVGAFLFSGEKEAEAVAPEVLSQRVVRPTLPDDVNPLSVATSSDYERAVEQFFAGGGDTIEAQRLFQQWALIDPDAAVLAISKIYHIHRASNMLSNLLVGMEKELTPSLVKHYGEFEYISHFDLHSLVGRSLSKLAQEDLDLAFDLLRKLPVAPGHRPIDDLMDRLDGPGLADFLTRVSGPDADLVEGANADFWRQLATRAWRVLPPGEYELLLTRFDQPEVVTALSRGALREALNFDRTDRFVRIFEALPKSKQDLALEVFTKGLQQYPEDLIGDFRESAESRESSRLLEAIQAHAEQ